MKTGEKFTLTEEQIKSIVEELEAGMNVYVHIETKEIKPIPDFDEEFGDTDKMEEDIKEIDENNDKYLLIEKMDSIEFFKVMEDFVITVEDEELRKKLDLGLSLSKPFRNFKDILGSEKVYRNKWFLYRSARYEEYVKEVLMSYNNTYDDEDSDI
jgi:hypothetical protein